MFFVGAENKDILHPDGFEVSKRDLLLSSLTINILSLAMPTMTLQIYDRILPNPGSGTLPVLITGVCIAVILETVMRLSRSYCMGWAGAAYEHRLSCQAINHILRSDLGAPVSYGIGEHMNRLAAIGRLRDFYNGYSTITIFELLFVPLFIMLIIYISGPLAIVPAAVLMLFTAISYFQGRTLRNALQERDEIDDARYNFLIESLEGIHSLKSFGLENIFSRRYEALEEESTIANYRVTEDSARAFDTASVFSHLMVAGIIGAGAVLVLQGTISTGALIATILLSGRIMQPVQRALGLWAKYQDYTISRQKVESIFEIPLHPSAPDEGASPEREGTLSLDNVSFRRSDSSPLLLQNISLDLPKGACISISSDNASSLDALLDIIAGLYAPTMGIVTVDGQNILRYAAKDLINHVGYIQSEGVIFRGTIRDNLTCFGQISDDKVQEMSALFQIDKDIASLPSGFDTFLSGSATDTIPPGLKQRIAMVRVLAPKPRLIIFDNADRALDRDGYNLVHNLLARLMGKATIIISSDDQNLTSQASQFFVLEKTRLREIPRNIDTRKNVVYTELSR
ncbi:MAG: ABC transporter [Micavibrio aeruginosavorus]|uniref:ABC transporter n=1 Tax=Micavibrio aeruginosavorus TaxID=349221 RepID=A0A2W5PW13_9BACT|nr:MAG: ABC transporter [Micavibrio aeruginosavorus]